MPKIQTMQAVLDAATEEQRQEPPVPDNLDFAPYLGRLLTDFRTHYPDNHFQNKGENGQGNQFLAGLNRCQQQLTATEADVDAIVGELHQLANHSTTYCPDYRDAANALEKIAQTGLEHRYRNTHSLPNDNLVTNTFDSEGFSAHALTDNGAIVGVYDQTCSLTLKGMQEDVVTAAAIPADLLAGLAPEAISDALQRASQQLGRTIHEQQAATGDDYYQKYSRYPAGSTFIAAFYHQQKLYIAHAGDSRAIWVSKDASGHYTAQRLNCTHNPHKPREFARLAPLLQTPANGLTRAEALAALQQNQGIPSRLFHDHDGASSLATSRAMGDYYIDPSDDGVTSDPEISMFDTEGKPGFLILGSDGIFDEDKVTEHDLPVLCQAHADNPAQLALALRNRAFQRGSDDNMSVFISPFTEQTHHNESGFIAVLGDGHGGSQHYYREEDPEPKFAPPAKIIEEQFIRDYLLPQLALQQQIETLLKPLADILANDFFHQERAADIPKQTFKTHITTAYQDFERDLLAEFSDCQDAAAIQAKATELQSTYQARINDSAAMLNAVIAIEKTNREKTKAIKTYANNRVREQSSGIKRGLKAAATLAVAALAFVGGAVTGAAVGLALGIWSGPLDVLSAIAGAGAGVATATELMLLLIPSSAAFLISGGVGGTLFGCMKNRYQPGGVIAEQLTEASRHFVDDYQPPRPA